ncbi:hypothetical protein ACWD5F_44320 [Streptomyces sp. NPDC002499]
MRTRQSRPHTGPGTLAAFARFVLCGGAVGIASSLTVAAAASWMPWPLANAVVTALSTLLATELHARFTFGAGGRATRRQHAQSAGSAAAAYAATCGAALLLHLLVTAPTAVLDQAVYLSASALAGLARFTVLRLVVFARTRPRPRPATCSAAVPVTRAPRPLPAAGAAPPAGPAALCPAA